MNFLQMSRSGAVMILAIVVIRALAIHKLPKKAFLALWGVAAARLLIPFSFPSAFSVYSLLERLDPAAEAVKDIPAAPFTPAPPAHNVILMPGTAAVHTASVLIDPWTVAWLVGGLACAMFFAVAYLKCRREFKASLPVDNEYAKHWLSEHHICRTIEIRQSGRISAPLTYGVLRPVILMPKTADWDDLETLNYVLTHEYVHIRRFDAVTKLVLTAALCVHWFNPAVWIMYVLANRDIELSCDEAVIRQFGERTKSAYAMTLIHMEEAQNSLTPLCNNFSKNAIEERIIAIMKIKKTSLVALIVAIALVVGVTTAFATSAKADERSSNEDLDRVLDKTATVIEESMMTSYVDPRDGKTYYSFDGGKTFEPLTDEEFATRFPTPKVEWWTYDEYKEWLENEKVELQSMIGERAWTSGRGDFVWTQEIVDEAIAMYESILEDIGRGMLYSKTIDGEANTSLMMAMNPADIEKNSEPTEALLEAYVPFGLAYEIDPTTGELSMNWQGKPVHSVFDAEKSVWIANSLRGLYLGPDAVDLEAVYERDNLTGLRETQPQQAIQPEPAAPAPENRWGVPDGEIPEFTDFAVESFEDGAELGKYLERTHGLYPGDYSSVHVWPSDTYYLQVHYEEKKIRERLIDGTYPVNSKGETYGSALDHQVVGYDPDLIAVQAANGVNGYALRDAFRYCGYPGPMSGTIEDWDAYFEWQKSRPRPLTIPVYDVEHDNAVGYLEI